MNNTSLGWTLGGAALLSMLGLMAVDIKAIHSWSEVFAPAFVGQMFAHISSVGMAFVGGKLIPTSPQDQRKDDK